LIRTPTVTPEPTFAQGSRVRIYLDRGSGMILAAQRRERIVSVATVIGSLNRRGPALPGLIKRAPPCLSMPAL